MSSMSERIPNINREAHNNHGNDKFQPSVQASSDVSRSRPLHLDLVKNDRIQTLEDFVPEDSKDRGSSHQYASERKLIPQTQGHSIDEKSLSHSLVYNLDYLRNKRFEQKRQLWLENKKHEWKAWQMGQWPKSNKLWMDFNENQKRMIEEMDGQ